MAGKVRKKEFRLVINNGVFGIHFVNHDEDGNMEIEWPPLTLSANSFSELQGLIDTANTVLVRPTIRLTTVRNSVDVCGNLIGASVRTQVNCNLPAGHSGLCTKRYSQTS